MAPPRHVNAPRRRSGSHASWAKFQSLANRDGLERPCTHGRLVPRHGLVQQCCPRKRTVREGLEPPVARLAWCASGDDRSPAHPARIPAPERRGAAPKPHPWARGGGRGISRKRMPIYSPYWAFAACRWSGRSHKRTPDPWRMAGELLAWSNSGSRSWMTARRRARRCLSVPVTNRMTLPGSVSACRAFRLPMRH